MCLVVYVLIIVHMRSIFINMFFNYCAHKINFHKINSHAYKNKISWDQLEVDQPLLEQQSDFISLGLKLEFRVLDLQLDN